MISRNQQLGLLALALTALGVVAVLGASPVQEASAARQTCNQDDTLIAACVNANVEKNNICVGVISENDRCTQ
jgi:hypothetical protein